MPSDPVSRLSSDDWETLVDNINAGACTPFLGAGVNYGFLPTGSALAARWAQVHSYPLPDMEDLPKVAQYIAVKKKDAMWPKRNIVQEFQRSSKSQDFSSEDNPLGLVAQLPLPIYITTNYDNYLIEALKGAGKKPRLELCRWNDAIGGESVLSKKSGYVPSVNEPLVFHLHGHQDKPESLVLTEDDYLEFLVCFSKRKDLLDANIQGALAKTSLMFIGYKMADWDFRVILHGVLTSTSPTLRSISISVQLPLEKELPEKAKPNAEAAQAYLQLYFANKMNVSVFWGTAREFTNELRRRWQAKRAGAAVSGGP